MGQVASYEFYFGLFQIGLCLLIAGTCYRLYIRNQSDVAKERLGIFGGAFLLYALKISLRLYTPERGLLEPSLVLFLYHSLGVIFFLLLGTVGLLHFVGEGGRGTVKKASLVLIGALLLFDSLYIAYASADPTVVRHVIGLSKALHITQILVLAFVTVAILSRIPKEGYLQIFTTLPQKYTLGSAVVLLMLADVGHILNLTVFEGMEELNLLEYLLATIALWMITWRVYELSAVPPPAGEEMETSRDEVTAIDNILRQVYFGMNYMDLGERDIVFNDFLEKTRLRPLFDETRIGIDAERLLAAVEREPRFLFEIAGGLLAYFRENPQRTGELQTHYLTEYLRMLHLLTEGKDRRECPACGKRSCRLYSLYHRRSREGPERYAELWKGLSSVYGSEAYKYLHHFEKLKGWGVVATNAFFETDHSTGSEGLDGRMGRVPSKSFLLGIRDASIDKKRFFEPIVRRNLSEWRNVVYISIEPLEKLLVDFETSKPLISEGRLTLISLFPTEEGLASSHSSGYRINESSEGILKCVNELLPTLPMSSIILAMDLNPLLIKESPERFHGFLTALIRETFRRNVTIFASVTENMSPVHMDLLNDRADIVLRYSLHGSEIVTTVLKPSLGERIVLRKELYEILQWVTEENGQGRDPTFGDVKERWEITPVTARRRINELVNEDLLEVQKRGRSKTLRITERGREVLFARRSEVSLS
jgi:predicted transcriptional regulator